MYNSQNNQQVKPQTLEKSLLICAQAVRHYRYSTPESLNTFKGGDNAWE
ncbi:hypothetical protein [Komarekiella delphini-convector]